MAIRLAPSGAVILRLSALFGITLIIYTPRPKRGSYFETVYIFLLLGAEVFIYTPRPKRGSYFETSGFNPAIIRDECIRLAPSGAVILRQQTEHYDE